MQTDEMNGAPRKASISDETFDEFLATQSLLEDCEQAALAEITRDQASQSPLPGGEGLGVGERGR